MTGTVVITGAGSGIGLAAALHYAGKGWRVGLIGRGEAALLEARRQVEQAGGAGHVAIADVVDSAALERAATAIEAALGPIDVWVNNAGIGFYGAFVDVPEEAFRRVVDVNVHGTVNGTRVALARMRPRNRGTIVQILSAIADRGVPLQIAYSTTKYALRGFVEALRAELIHERSRVQVTMVHPPSVNTPFYSHAGSVMDETPRPPPPVYQPEMVGEAIYLAGTGNRRQWRVAGQTVATSIGNTLAPGLVDLVAGLFGVALQQTTRQDVAAVRDPSVYGPSTRIVGLHGPFDREALSTSATWWVTKNPAAACLGLGLGLGLGLSLLAAGAARVALRRR